MVDKPTSRVDRWLENARNGSTEALGQALEACRAYLLMIAESEMQGGPRAKEGASDMVQETFMEAQRAFDRFNGVSEKELLAWLRRMLLNNVVDFRRRYLGAEKRDVARELGPPGTTSSQDWGSLLACSGLSPSGQIGRDEDLLQLQQAIQKLPDEYRMVIEGRYLDDLPFDEIAQRLGKSSNATRKLFARAVERLRRDMDAPA